MLLDNMLDMCNNTNSLDKYTECDWLDMNIKYIRLDNNKDCDWIDYGK